MARDGIVETTELTKHYGDVAAVDHLNLRVDAGEIFGFLGPNGAGKTTTILMLLGLSEPTSGQARVCGYDASREALKVKRLVGYLPENLGFYEDLTAEQNLGYTAQLNGLSSKQARERISRLLDMVGLSEAVAKKVGEFSRGMKQRLGIADVLVKEPRMVIMDEPTLGIDPEGSHHILDIIVNINREQGVTVLLSSHLLHQVQRICQRVGIMARGQMVALGNIEHLRRQMREENEVALEVQASPLTPSLLERMKAIPGIKKIDRSGDLLHIISERDVRQEVSQAVLESQSTLLHLRLQDYTLEEIYLRYFREAP